MGWTTGYKCLINVPAAQISGTTHSAFPVLLTRDCFPDDMFDPSGTPCQTNGGDLIFATDTDGDNRIACEIVGSSITLDTSTGSGDGACEIWVLVTTLATNSGSGTDFYVRWSGDGGESQPATGASYGRDAVWAAYTSVHHGGSLVDSSGNLSDLTAVNSPSVANGVTPWGGSAYELNGTSQYLAVGSAPLSAVPCCISGWSRPDNATATHAIASICTSSIENRSRFVLWEIGSAAGDPLSVLFSDTDGVWYSTANSTGGFTANSWNFCVGAVDASNNSSVWVNGAGKGTASPNGAPTFVGDRFAIGVSYDLSISQHHDGELAEVRTAALVPSDDWVETEYNNQSAPASFAVAGTPAAIGGGATVTGDLAAQETGSDSAAIVGAVQIAGTIAAQESGADSASIVGSVAVTGDLAAQESGADTLAISGTAPTTITGTFAAIESGADIGAFTGAVLLTGTLAAQEVGSDTSSIAGSILVAGTLSVQEAGSDTAAITGAVVPIGGGYLSAQETGADTAAIVGAVHVSGTLSVQEAGSDSLAISGTAPVAISGTLAVTEAGSDTGIILGHVFVNGTLAAQESGGDTLLFTQADGTHTFVSGNGRVWKLAARDRAWLLYPRGRAWTNGGSC